MFFHGKPPTTFLLIVALTIMAKNPKDYDLENLDFDQPVEYDSMDLDSAHQPGAARRRQPIARSRKSRN